MPEILWEPVKGSENAVKYSYILISNIYTLKHLFTLIYTVVAGLVAQSVKRRSKNWMPLQSAMFLSTRVKGSIKKLQGLTKIKYLYVDINMDYLGWKWRS